MTASGCSIPPVHPPDRWYFTKDQILHSPSVKTKIPAVKETSYRQHAALLIQEMGQKLKVWVQFQSIPEWKWLYLLKLFHIHAWRSCHVCPKRNFTPNSQIKCWIIEKCSFRNQLCINTAIVYMHRFYTCHSFTVFHRNVSYSLKREI